MWYDICRHARVLCSRRMDAYTHRDLRFDIQSSIYVVRETNEISQGPAISDKVDTLLRGDPRPSEEFYRDTLDSLEECVAVLDAGGTVIAVNVALERFTRRYARRS